MGQKVGGLPLAAATVATTVAGLGAKSDGKIGRLRVGSTPFDFTTVIYDATYGKWVSEDVVNKMSTAQSGNSASTTYVAYTVTEQALGMFPMKALLDAGLTLQLRNFCLFSAGTAGQTASISADITAYNDGGTFTHILGPGAAAPSDVALLQVTGTTLTAKSSGWVDVSPSSFDYMNFGWYIKVSGGAAGIFLHTSLHHRWVG